MPQEIVVGQRFECAGGEYVVTDVYITGDIIDCTILWTKSSLDPRHTNWQKGRRYHKFSIYDGGEKSTLIEEI